MPAGEYDLDISYFLGNVGDQQVYAVLAEGNTIPNPSEVDPKSNPNGKKVYKLEDYDSIGAKTVTWNFTLSEATELSLGFAVTVGDKKYFEVSEFKLTLK